MSQYYFVATLVAHIELTDEEFQILFSEATKHYDAKVKASAKVGGFLFGFQNRRMYAAQAGEPDQIVEFSENQLDLMMKALEMNWSSEGRTLYNRLLNIFKDLQQQTMHANKPLNSLKFIGQFTRE